MPALRAQLERAFPRVLPPLLLLCSPAIPLHAQGTRADYERAGSPYYATARLWDDGVIDPLDTRRVLALGLEAAAQAPIPDPSYGIFRM